MCIDGVCASPFGHTYRISGIDVWLPSLSPDGDAWDAFGGAPDPYATVTLNGVLVLTTSYVSDVFDPGPFPETVDVIISSATSLTINVYDDDVAADDAAFLCTWNPVTAATLTSGTVTCSGALGSLTAHLALKY